MPGDMRSGHARSGHAVSGHAVSGHAVSGHAVSGQAVSGYAVSGYAVAPLATSAPSAMPEGSTVEAKYKRLLDDYECLEEKHKRLRKTVISTMGTIEQTRKNAEMKRLYSVFV